MMVYICTSLFK